MRPFVLFKPVRLRRGGSCIANSKPVGSTGVSDRRVDLTAALRGEMLTFRYADGRLVDEETGSTWAIKGRAVEGPLKALNASTSNTAIVLPSRDLRFARRRRCTHRRRGDAV
jgi:hypothetical protein